MLERFRQTQAETKGYLVNKPERWGGIRVTPLSIEFLTFRENRLHLRELYSRLEGNWSYKLLQP
ncbi:pyridoxine 5'-phosphate oxidase C-terminal domain-containing protein [Pectobacterium sp. A5351]|uniref:pyridoxine 5'-phosphate oxidase C-terminal domain-containing protein n=1 Tax=Pectobacterium sp. A5351 TaxID=2914983 RepID=UPI003FA68289